MTTSRKTAAKKPPATAAPRTRPRLRSVTESEAASSSEATFPHLFATDKPGVYRNSSGSLVGENGVLLSLNFLADAEALLDEEIIGKRVETPAELLKRIALDPRQPLLIRLDAAKAAAPYFDRKTPTSLETKNEDLSLDIAKIAAMPKAERLKLLDTLRNLGVSI